MKKLIVILIAIILPLIVAAQSEKRVFKIGSETLIPFEYLKNGEPAGINVEVVKAVFKELEIPIEFIFAEEKRSLAMAKDGDVDGILSVSYLKDREEFLLYPEGFRKESQTDFMWASRYVFYGLNDLMAHESIQNYQDIKAKGYKVGIIKGVSYSPDFWEADLDIVYGSSDEDNFNKLLKGEIDLYLTDKTIGDYTAKSMNISDKVSSFSVKIINKLYTFALSKKSDYPGKEQLLKAFFENHELLKKKGIVKKIMYKEMQ